jgi:hypothetical protein
LKTVMQSSYLMSFTMGLFVVSTAYSLPALGQSTTLPSAARFHRTASTKRLIYNGFDAPAAGHYAKHVQLAKASPFSGFAIQLEANEAGRQAVDKSFPADAMWKGIDWDPAWFAESTEKLREANSIASEHHNFLLFHANAEGVDWMDDAGWAKLTNHFRILALSAKKSGCKGLMFDPEPYPHHADNIPFAYDRQPMKAKFSFDQYFQMARQRGRESMQAMAGEFPDMTLFSLFLLSYLTVDMPHRGPDIASAQDPDAALKQHSYNLLLTFFLGWLESAPSSIQFVDGNEESYFYTNPRPYAVANDDIRRKALVLVPSSLQNRYRNQVQTAHTFLVDILYDASPLAIDRGGRSTEAMLRLKARWALDHSDQYVWTWAEAGRVLPVDERFGKWREKDPLWTERIPGFDSLLRQEIAGGASKTETLQSLLQSNLQDGIAREIITNPHFLEGKGDLATDWYNWQPDWSHGRVGWLQKASAIQMNQTIGGSVSQRREIGPATNDHVRQMHAVGRFASWGDARGVVTICQLDAQGKQLNTPSLVGETGSVKLPLDESFILKSGIGSKKPVSMVEIHARCDLDPNTHMIQIIGSAVGQGDEQDCLLVTELKGWLIP